MHPLSKGLLLRKWKQYQTGRVYLPDNDFYINNIVHRITSSFVLCTLLPLPENRKKYSFCILPQQNKDILRLLQSGPVRRHGNKNSVPKYRRLGLSDVVPPILLLTNYSFFAFHLVKKVVFKISILPVVKIISALFVHIFFVIFTIALFTGYQYYPDFYTLQIFYYSFSTMMLVLGLAYATSAMVIFFRDLSQIINIILQVGMWMTPILWNIDTMDLSPVLINIFKLNPMYYIVIGYRDSLINKIWFWERPQLTLYFWVLTILLFGIGTTIFKRLKVHFADVL